MGDIIVGDSLPVRDCYKGHIEDIKKQMDTHTTMMVIGADGHRASERKLWEFIKETMPETEEFHLSLDHIKMEVRIIGKK